MIDIQEKVNRLRSPVRHNLEVHGAEDMTAPNFSEPGQLSEHLYTWAQVDTLIYC